MAMNKGWSDYQLIRRCVAQAIEEHVVKMKAEVPEHMRKAPSADDIEQIRAAAVEHLYDFTMGEHPSLVALSAVDGILALQLITPTQVAPWRRKNSWEDPK